MNGVADLARLRPVYTLVGDEIYFSDRFRRSLLALLPPGSDEIAHFEEDLAGTPLEHILDRARMPSLMAPLQIVFVRNVKELYARGARKHGDFPANVAEFARIMGASSPPASVVVFVADHLHLPADRQRLGLEEKTRLERIEATLGAAGEIVWCGAASAVQAAALAQQMAAELGVKLAPPVANELAELLEGNLGLLQVELEKLALHAGPGAAIEAKDVAVLVAAAHSGGSYELANHLGRGQRAASWESLQRIWHDQGDAGAIGLVFQLSRAFLMAAIVREQKVRDRRGLYQCLPDGLKPPGFAADTILAIARHATEARLARGIQLLHRADVTLRSSPPSAKLVFEELVMALTEGGNR